MRLDLIWLIYRADSKIAQNEAIKYGNELKLVYPQKGLEPKNFKHLDFDHFFLQPMDGKDLHRNILQSVSYCIENPLWRLSLQTHKIMGID